ncbi:MAG: protein kinase [Pirellulales bacterium]|nr:protein kinase [Pirellulales bacterium]
MADDAPRELAELLERLGLSDALKARRVRARLRRLGRGLPQFQSVWVDALFQGRFLTPYQAAEIHAGRGSSLRLGPYVLLAGQAGPGYLRSYVARHVETPQAVHLSLIEADDEAAAERLAGSLDSLAAASRRLDTLPLTPVCGVGRGGRLVWVVQPLAGGVTAAEHLVRHGRMPAVAVLEVARQMAAALAHLELAGLPHGDLSAATLWLTAEGRAVLSAPGVRPIVRPAEGFTHADLAPEDYDTLAPERIDGGAAADSRTDLYACGCLWWRRLPGRPPFPGGNALARLRAHLSTAPADVRTLAPEVPPILAAAIGACLRRDPRERPASAAALAGRLGPPTPQGRRWLARSQRPGRRSAAPLHAPAGRPRSAASPWPIAAGGAALVAFAAVLWGIGLPAPAPSGNSGNSGEAVSRAAGSPPPLAERPLAESRDLVEDSSFKAASDAAEVVLDGGGPVACERVRLAAGARVRGPADGRATVLIRSAPLAVREEDVSFDGIDFVWQAGSPSAAAEETPAMLRIAAGRVRFRRCTFQAASGQGRAPAALHWVFPVDRGGLGLPTGKLVLADCVFHRVAPAIDARTAASLAIECDNLLHLGPGPLVRLDHAPAAGEPVSLVLTSVTCRQSGPVLEISDPAAIEKPGAISIDARLSVFEPRPGEPLLLLAGPQEPGGLVKAIYWTGEGALVAPEARIAIWRKPSGARTELNDAAFSIAGLVRSPVQFAGAAEPILESNAAQRWQAPLPSAEAPGIRAASLPQPVR